MTTFFLVFVDELKILLFLLRFLFFGVVVVVLKVRSGVTVAVA